MTKTFKQELEAAYTKGYSDGKREVATGTINFILAFAILGGIIWFVRVYT